MVLRRILKTKRFRFPNIYNELYGVDMMLMDVHTFGNQLTLKHSNYSLIEELIPKLKLHMDIGLHIDNSVDKWLVHRYCTILPSISVASTNMKTLDLLAIRCPSTELGFVETDYDIFPSCIDDSISFIILNGTRVTPERILSFRKYYPELSIFTHVHKNHHFDLDIDGIMMDD